MTSDLDGDASFISALSMNKRQKVDHMKRQQRCAVALIFGCVFAAPSTARQNPQATVGPVIHFCGERVCPTYLSTSPKVVDRGTARRHRVVRAALPKPRPMDAKRNPGHGPVSRNCCRRHCCQEDDERRFTRRRRRGGSRFSSVEQLRHLRIARPAWVVALTQRGN